MNQDFQEQLKLIVEHSLHESETPGATLAVYINGQPFLETSVGYQDIKHEVLLPNNAKFYIYSITKSLLATAALSLVDQGQLDIDASVQPYLPNFSLDTSITLRQLLSHTSGLADYGETSTYRDAVKASPNSPWSVETFLNFAKTQGLQFTPGEGWTYSNIGYLLLRCVLESVAGLSIQQLLQEVIFKPLSLQKILFLALSMMLMNLHQDIATFSVKINFKMSLSFTIQVGSRIALSSQLHPNLPK